MLHITNGDAAVGRLREAGIAGDMLPWRDVLHEGPVPAGLPLAELRAVRARFIAERGWGEFVAVLDAFTRRDATLAGFRDHDEVVLWFEHDLYDQLQLIQLLDWLAQQDRGATQLSLIAPDTYIGTLRPEQLRDLFLRRHAITPQEFGLGSQAWAAFRAPDPQAIAALLQADTAALPFLAGALHRHLEQFPATQNGLSRSEAQALAAITSGRSSIREAYIASHHEMEERIFLGDTVFAWYLERLSQGPNPLVLLEDGGAITTPREPGAHASFWNSRVVLTGLGQAVLDGGRDWIAINGIDRWLGGVHLSGSTAAWRWDAAARQLHYIDT